MLVLFVVLMIESSFTVLLLSKHLSHVLSNQMKQAVNVIFRLLLEKCAVNPNFYVEIRFISAPVVIYGPHWGSTD